jgi:probable F420-dependent oxidoreductase
MKVGIHLAQFGRSASPDAIRGGAKRAEELGFSDVWVSDHIVVPAAQDYPSPYLYDPFVTLTWAAAATTTIGLGTSVIVAPQYHPLWLANTLASLDALSTGRVIAGLGIGWSEAEFAALDQPFRNRGRRLDEIIDVLRVAWRDDPSSHAGEFYDFTDMRVLPKPARDIPVWVGGTSDAAYARAFTRGDGYHAIGLDTDGVRAMVKRVRETKPDESFTISLRTGWDPQGMDPDRIRRECDEWEEAGLQHVVAAHWRSSPDEYMKSMEMLAGLVVPS